MIFWFDLPVPESRLPGIDDPFGDCVCPAFVGGPGSKSKRRHFGARSQQRRGCHFVADENSFRIAAAPLSIDQIVPSLSLSLFFCDVRIFIPFGAMNGDVGEDSVSCSESSVCVCARVSERASVYSREQS